MIYYAHDMERWEDSDDDNFVIHMTPEGEAGSFPEFQNRLDFWKYYSNDENCPDFENIQTFREWYYKR